MTRFPAECNCDQMTWGFQYGNSTRHGGRSGGKARKILRLLVALAAVPSGPASAQTQRPTQKEALVPEGSLGRCLNALSDTSTAEVVCAYEAVLTDDERRDMQAITRGLLADAGCLVAVRVSRDKLAPALAPDANTTFQAPAQPVTCEIKTSRGELHLKGTFAPKVVFKNGTAVSATPGLANVEGVSSALAWPVVQYVNRSPGIGRQIIEIINAYRGRFVR